MELVCVGTELLSGGKVNTHAAYLARRLREAGLAVRRESTVADGRADIRGAVAGALSRARAVVVCGGLGPTFDDLTREAVAEALGRPLRYRPALYRLIHRRYQRFRLRVPPNNKRQAWVIEGAKVLDNPRGSAPGQMVPLACGGMVFLLPGPFREMSPIFEDKVLPALRRFFRVRGSTAVRVLRIYGLAESAVERRLAAMLREDRDAEFTILASLGLVDLHVCVRASGSRAAAERLSSIENTVRGRMGRHLYGTDGQTLASAVGSRLRALGWSLSAAESCTGGLVSKMLTDVPGSSDYFRGGVVSYHDAVKGSVLGVRERTLAGSGAVSGKTALEMARGVRRVCGTEAGVALTGIAGPGGARPGKPVGLVHFAVSLPGLSRSFKVVLPGPRDLVRRRAAHAALFSLFTLLRPGRSHLAT